jgi:hypothetical protein
VTAWAKAKAEEMREQVSRPLVTGMWTKMRGRSGGSEDKSQGVNLNVLSLVSQDPDEDLHTTTEATAKVNGKLLLNVCGEIIECILHQYLPQFHLSTSPDTQAQGRMIHL